MINVSAFVKSLDKKPVAVFGLARSGLSTIRALKAAGAQVLAWDDDPETHAKAKRAGSKIIELTPTVLRDCAMLVLAPGVPLHYPRPHPVVSAAQAMGLEVLSDVEILHRCDHHRMVIGITGSNGKSTTTALIGHILNICGKSAAVGGNIGVPVLDLDMPPKNGLFVLEVSSYQLDLCPSFTPDIAVLMNITPDHIDRHGSMENYAASKEKILVGDGVGIVGIDDEYSLAIYNRTKDMDMRKLVPVSVGKKAPGGVYVRDNILFDDMKGKNREIGSLANIITLSGRHNMQNAAAAYAVCRSTGLSGDEILAAMKTYPGLPHRQFPARVINGVAYINDSTATTGTAAGKALACYNNIYWILGGKPKEGGLNGVESLLGNVRHAFLIGEASDAFGAWLKKYGVPHQFCDVMETAVEKAHMMAQGQRGQPGGGGVVLLSPACASFDQYKSFEERGEHFMKLVKNLKKDMAA